VHDINILSRYITSYIPYITHSGDMEVTIAHNMKTIEISGHSNRKTIKNIYRVKKLSVKFT